MNQEKIGKFISKCRKEKKLTQEELAEKLGVSDRTIGNWENGRNMPDLSLFKPLCEILDISINDLMSGEKVDKKDYQEKLEENIITTIEYSNKKITSRENIIVIIIITIGVLLSFLAYSLIPSDSSWGSVYSVIGGIIALIGFSKLTKKFKIGKRLVLNFIFIFSFIILLMVVDYLGVILIHQAPRFSIIKVYEQDAVYYDTLFYDVIRCNVDKNNETYTVISNQKYDDMNATGEFCYNKRVERLKEQIDYSFTHTNYIVVSTLVDGIDQTGDKSYTFSVDKRPHEIITTLSKRSDIDKIIGILNKVQYPRIMNAIGYSTLFQLYEDDKLILEFRQNELCSKDECVGIAIDPNKISILEEYYK